MAKRRTSNAMRRAEKREAMRAAREARMQNPGGASKYATKGTRQSRPNREERLRGETRRWPVFCPACYRRVCGCHEYIVRRIEELSAELALAGAA